jgi:hypothetical protein
MTANGGDDLVFGAHQNERCGKQLLYGQAETSDTVRGRSRDVVGDDHRLHESLKLRWVDTADSTIGDVLQLRLDLIGAPTGHVPMAISERPAESGEPDDVRVGTRPSQQLRVRRADRQRDP